MERWRRNDDHDSQSQTKFDAIKALTLRQEEEGLGLGLRCFESINA